MNHNDAVNQARLTAASVGWKVFRREVGLFYDRRGNPRRVGTEGEGDLQGWRVGDGRATAIEVKTGNARRTKEQKRWGESFVRDGGIYVVARYSDTEDGDEAIRAAAGLVMEKIR